MRSNKIISLLMAVLIWCASLVALCPAGHGEGQDVHFIAEMCESHDCSRNAEPQTCQTENCDHQICTDQSLTDVFRPISQYQTALFPQTLVQFFDDLFGPELRTFAVKHFQVFPPSVSSRTTVLRI